MAHLETKNLALTTASPVAAGPVNITKAALLLSVAAVALTGAFVFGFGDGERQAASWFLPMGSVLGLTFAALSLQGKPVYNHLWLACGTLALATAAAVSTGIITVITALVAAGAFLAGLAFAFGKSIPRSDDMQTPLENSQQAAVSSSLFFDEIIEIDRKSKIKFAERGTFDVGSTFVELVHIADRPAFLMACSHASNVNQDLIVRVQDKATSFFVETQIRLHLKAGRVFAALRRAETNLAVVDPHDVICELAHELRTPLAAIVGFADALSEHQTCTDDMRRHYPALIAGAGRNLIELTGAILQPNVNADKKPAALLATVAQECVALLQPLAEQKSIVLFNRVPIGLADKLVDGVALRQILINLISNAIKFSPNEASVELSASVAANGWMLKVTDNGTGLSPEDVARLGQKNFRSNNATGIAGYGLGLSIVSRLVEKIEGRISFESRPGKGTQVTIAFPASTLVAISEFQSQAQIEPANQTNLDISRGEKHAAA